MRRSTVPDKLRMSQLLDEVAAIMGRAVEKGIVNQKDRNTILHSMFWTGLKTELKDISGHMFDSIKNFDELGVSVRHIGKNGHRKSNTKPHTTKVARSSKPIQQPQMVYFMGVIHQLTTRMDRWDTQFSRKGRSYRPNRRRQQRQKYQDQPQQDQASPDHQEQTKKPNASDVEDIVILRRGALLFLTKINSL